MPTYQSLPLGVGSYLGDEDSNTFVVEGIRTEYEPNCFSYSYGVYSLSTLGGNDAVYLRNLTAIDPTGVNPRARQVVDLGGGNDFTEIKSLTAATVYGGDGDDSIIKVDLRERSTGDPRENQWEPVTQPPHIGPDGLFQDPNWLDFNIVDGGEGNDTITMGNGPDWVYGGNGSDYISLGSGNNVAFAGTGNDTILVGGLQHYYNVSGTLSNPRTAYYAPSSNAIWAGEGDDSVTISNIAAMGSLAAAVNGEAGNDTITISAAGSSWITGGEGDDTISLTSVLDWWSGYGAVYRQAHDNVWGEAGNDTISTDRGNDIVVGGSGHDWIFGGLGSDHLYGAMGSGVDDGESDRFSFGPYRSEQFFSTVKDVDTIYDFEPGSRFPGQAGRGDIIDLAGMFAASSSDALVYDAGNPFLQGELRLLADGADTLVQATDGAGGWDSFLRLLGVTPGELNTTVQADVSGGLVAKTGGDFLWYTG